MASRPPGENLRNRAAPRVITTLDHVSFKFVGDHEFQSGKLFTETGQRHQQFRRFWPASSECQLCRRIGFKDQNTAKSKAKHSIGVNLAPQCGRQVDKNRNDSRPRIWRYTVGCEIRSHRFNLDAPPHGQVAGLGQTDL